MNERGGIITGFFLKLVVGLALLGIVLFEAGAVIAAKVQVDGVAVTAAQDAAAQYGKDQNIDSARAVAAQDCTTSGATLVSIDVSSDGGIVTVTVRKIAKTFLIQHIGPLARWRIATATQQAGVH